MAVGGGSGGRQPHPAHRRRLLGWSLMLIVVLYWVESGIVGLINVFKIARAQGPSSFGVGGSRIKVHEHSV
jgi:hypothetical protein